MSTLHVTQDRFGFWQLSLEDNAGNLRLLAHHSESPAHLIEDAHELVADGKYPDAVVIVDPPRAEVQAAGIDVEAYEKPAARKAGER